MLIYLFLLLTTFAQVQQSAAKMPNLTTEKHKQGTLKFNLLKLHSPFRVFQTIAHKRNPRYSQEIDDHTVPPQHACAPNSC